MLKKTFLLFFVVQFVVAALFAQNKTIDSLLTLLKKDKLDTSKVIHLNNLTLQYQSMGIYDTALYYGNNAFQLAEKINFKNGIASSYNNIGIIYYEQGNYIRALENYFAALKIREETGDKNGIASSHNNIGAIYFYQNNYAKALENYFISLKIAQGRGSEKVIAASLNNIGNIYSDQRNYDKALENHFASLKISEAIGNKQGVASSYNNIGDVYRNKGQFEESLKYYFESLRICQDIDDKEGIAIAYNNIGNIMVHFKKYNEAEEYLDKGLRLSREIGIKNDIKESYIGLTTMDSARSDFKGAFQHYKMFIAYRDSLLNAENTRKMVQAQVTSEFEKKAAAEKLERSKKEIIDTENRSKQKIITNGVIIFLLMLIAVIVLVLWQQRLRAKKDKIIFENKQLIAKHEKESIESKQLLAEQEKESIKNKQLLVEQENILLISEKQRMEADLDNSKKMLNQYTETMLEKIDILEQYKEEIKKLTNLKSKELQEERTEHLDYLYKSSIFTDKDWEKFKELFEQVHKSFFIRLQDRLPNLTQAEIKLICLTKLRLTTKQMVGILVISADSIKKNRNRLRKKLNLTESESLEDFSDSI